jgi:hypothetical protein
MYRSILEHMEGYIRVYCCLLKGENLNSELYKSIIENNTL